MNVGFSFYLIYNIEAYFLYNRINFLKKHKLLPMQLIWLHLVYGKMFCFARHPLFDGVCGILFFITLLAHLFAIIVPTCWHSCQYVSMMADGIANFFFVGCDRCYWDSHCSQYGNHYRCLQLTTTQGQMFFFANKG